MTAGVTPVGTRANWLECAFASIAAGDTCAFENPGIIHAAIVAMDGREPAQTETGYAAVSCLWASAAVLLFNPKR